MRVASSLGIVAILLLAGCVGNDPQVNVYHATLGRWSHAVAIDESAAILANEIYNVPFAAQNRTPNDHLNASYAFRASNGTLQACIFHGTAQPSWKMGSDAGMGCANGTAGGAEGFPITVGNYTLGFRCVSADPCALRYDLRIEGTGEPASVA